MQVEFYMKSQMGAIIPNMNTNCNTCNTWFSKKTQQKHCDKHNVPKNHSKEQFAEKVFWFKKKGITGWVLVKSREGEGNDGARAEREPWVNGR